MGDAGKLDVTRNNIYSLNIMGFGACMIGGFPDVSESFFRIACDFVSIKLECSIDSSVKSLHGFSAPRAEKHIKKLICLKPDYVIFQFGSSDASCGLGLSGVQIKRRVSAGTGLRAALPSSRKLHPPTPLTLLRWQVSSFIGHFLNPTPVTDLESFIAAYESMITQCISSDITPVVLSPFIFGTRHSMNNAIRYAQSLNDLCLKLNGAVYVDCIDPLSKFPKSQILLDDAMHLGQLGHKLVGEAVGNAIFDDVVAKKYDARTLDNASPT